MWRLNRFYISRKNGIGKQRDPRYQLWYLWYLESVCLSVMVENVVLEGVC